MSEKQPINGIAVILIVYAAIHVIGGLLVACGVMYGVPNNIHVSIAVLVTGALLSNQIHELKNDRNTEDPRTTREPGRRS